MQLSFLGVLTNCLLIVIAHHNINFSAYVVIKGGPQSLETQQARDRFEKEVQEWTAMRVAKHKYLRGGKYPESTLLAAILIWQSVLYSAMQVSWLLMSSRKGETCTGTWRQCPSKRNYLSASSAAGKILRRQLRDRAKEELKAGQKRKAAL